MTTPEMLQPAYRATDSQPEVLHHLPHLLGLEPSDFHIHWPLKKRPTWTSRQNGSEGKGGDAWVGGTATKRLLFFWEIYVLVGRWRRCAGPGGNCTEGKMYFIYIFWFLFLMTLVKGEVVPLQAWTGPEGSRKLRFPDFVTTAQDGGRLSALRTGRLYPQEILLVLISVTG